MNFHVDNLVWLLTGCLIGGVLGYMVRALQDIKEKVDEVDEIVKKERRPSRVRDERGFVRIPIVADMMLLIVIVLTVWASFSSQKASNEVEATNKRLAIITKCNQQVVTELLQAVNERTTSAQEASRANAELQKAWYRFVRFQLHLPPYPEADRRAKANLYADRLHEFVTAAEAQLSKQIQYPYPATNATQDCIDGR